MSNICLCNTFLIDFSGNCVRLNGVKSSMEQRG